ncbi:DUF6918 family protein [Actinomycetospora sp. TBRC 11914]|uniref:DUF6918 family protein n=1 Tax=Actinomycetospora sp. TBRC 11914 TaxID=2729387 RepID=UPI00145C407F|nr:hypothetical protein [Actinomycetospora sp. TBRC 11914]NMO90497.1 hypothetical protein [Actinomycetospora sp. TBRC 11914]
MAVTLKAALLDSDKRGYVVDDLAQLVDDEVKDKSGLSGGMIKTGYAAVKKVKPGIIWGAINTLLDEFVEALEPHWTAYQAAPTGDFGAYLAAHSGPVSEALLGVTDRRAAKSDRAAVTSVYSKLRPKAQENVVEALPRLGAVVEKHAGQ